MKFVIRKYHVIFFFLFIAIRTLSQEPLIENSIFSVGEKNARPESQDSPLVEGEFSVLVGSGDTVQARDRKSFPQNLQPGQRIAVFLNDIPLDKHMLLETVIAVNPDRFGMKSPAFEISYNEKLLCRNVLEQRATPVSVFIPCPFSEKGGNILQIRNVGTHAFAFNYIKLTEWKFPNAEKIDNSNDLSDEVMAILGKVDDMGKSDAVFQKKLLSGIPYDITAYLKDGGEFFPFDKFINNKCFYDSVSREPLITFFSASRSAKLFEGSPSIVPCNLVLNNKDRPLIFANCIGVLNSEDVMTAQICSKVDYKDELRFILPVPWSGKTKYIITSGFIPEKLSKSYPDTEAIKSEEKVVDIADGIFDINLSLKKCATIRLMKEEAKNLLGSNSSSNDKKGRAVFKKGILAVETKRDDLGALVRTPTRKIDMETTILGGSYLFKKIEATKAKINTVENVVPWDSKSDSLEISYPNNKYIPCEGANISYAKSPSNYKEFSFWVYPRSSSPVKKTTLQFYLENDKGCQFLAVDLKPDEWQRIILAPEKIKLPSTGKICIVGDPKLPEYAKGNKVTFEFNGFCTVGDEHPEKGKTGLQKSRVAGADRKWR